MKTYTELGIILAAMVPGVDNRNAAMQSDMMVFENGRVRTFNDEIAISAPCAVIKGSFAVSADTLIRAVNSLGDEEIDVQHGKDGAMILTAKRVKYTLPVVSDVTQPNAGKIPPMTPVHDDFIKALALCVESCAQSMASPALGSVHVSDNYVESCDNFRASRVMFKSAKGTDVMLPWRGLVQLLRRTPKAWAVANDWIHFLDAAGITLSMRKPADKYPPLDKIFAGHEAAKEIKFPAGLSAALDKARALDGDDDFVTLEMTDGKMIVKRRTMAGSMRAVVPWKGDMVNEFQVNGPFLKEMLSKGVTVHLDASTVTLRQGTFCHIVSLRAPKVVDQDAE